MSLLFAERPLVINTQLAMKIGLNEAIVLQQLHYWLRDTNSGMECDGVRWIYNTTEQWLELKWHTEFGHLNRGDMLTSEQHRCSNEKKKFQRRV